MTLALDGIAPLLHVADMARSVAFYRDVLSFRLVASEPRGAAAFVWCMLAQGELAIMLSLRPAGAGAPSGGIALYFGCPDVDEAHRQVTARGWTAAPPVTNEGMRRLHLQDPDGYELCLQHPA
ncbi:MAG: VOC family protein [Kofleriaceae bacterium]